MPDSDANHSGSQVPAAPTPSNAERRRNHALRELVDEMLEAEEPVEAKPPVERRLEAAVRR